MAIDENKLDTAENYAKEALVISQDISNNHLMAASLENLAMINKKQNKFKKALEYFEKFKNLSDTINKYDARAITAQIELKNEENKFILEKANQETKLIYSYVIASIVFISLIVILRVIFNRYKIKKNLSAQLLEMNHTKDKLFSIISHDLKTPLSGFKNLSKLIRENNENLSEEEKKQFYQNFENTSDNLLKLLDNLLNWSQIQTGKIHFFPESHSLKDLIESEQSLFNNLSKLKSVNFSTEIEDCNIFADKEMMKTVFRNLFANAIKYSNPSKEILIKTSVNYENVIIEIRDYGVGISKEDSKFIFGIDNKISRIGTNGEKGTGLGLILCKEFIEKNNGRIWFESEKGIGTSFFISLPLDIEN